MGLLDFKTLKVFKRYKIANPCHWYYELCLNYIYSNILMAAIGEKNHYPHFIKKEEKLLGVT